MSLAFADSRPAPPRSASAAARRGRSARRGQVATKPPLSRAEKIGPHVAALVGQILTRKYPHPDQGIRSCLGLLSLARAYSTERLDAACGHAVRHQRLSSRSVKSILVHGLDQPPVESVDPAAEPSPALPPAGLHENVRGAEYFA